MSACSPNSQAPGAARCKFGGLCFFVAELVKSLDGVEVNAEMTKVLTTSATSDSRFREEIEIVAASESTPTLMPIATFRQPLPGAALPCSEYKLQ